MRFQTAMAAAVLLASGCVRQSRTQTAGLGSAQATPVAPKTVWDRQIQNATDAGDGDYELRVLRERVEGDAANVPARLELAKAYSQRGYKDVALEICRLAAARFPDSSEAQLALVRALHDVNLRAEATQVVTAYMSAHPQAGAGYHSWLGILRDEAGEWSQGEPHHRQAVTLEPASDALHNNLGYNLLMQKKNDEAVAEFREALRLNPSSQVARNNLGLALANRNAAEAVANWKTSSDSATAHNNLAAVWIEKKDYVEARKELEIALSYNKSHPAALHNLELVSRLDGEAGDDSYETCGIALGSFEDGVRPLLGRPVGFARGRGKAADSDFEFTRRETMKALLVRFVRDEQGQDLVEYALIVAAVGLALITTVNQLSAGIVSLYQSITGDLASIGTPAA